VRPAGARAGQHPFPRIAPSGHAPHDHGGSLAAVAWALRDNLSFYDALYVALAAALDAPLITADARLASAPHLPCVTEVVG